MASHVEITWGSHTISWRDFDIAERTISGVYQQTFMREESDSFNLFDFGKGNRFMQLKAKWED